MSAAQPLGLVDVYIVTNNGPCRLQEMPSNSTENIPTPEISLEDHSLLLFFHEEAYNLLLQTHDIFWGVYSEKGGGSVSVGMHGTQQVQGVGCVFLFGTNLASVMLTIHYACAYCQHPSGRNGHVDEMVQNEACYDGDSDQHMGAAITDEPQTRGPVLRYNYGQHNRLWPDRNHAPEGGISHRHISDISGRATSRNLLGLPNNRFSLYWIILLLIYSAYFWKLVYGSCSHHDINMHGTEHRMVLQDCWKRRATNITYVILINK